MNSTKYNVRVQFDGGCVPNPGQKYGSFSIVFDEVFELSRHRFDLGYGTNNEAEFESLIEALKVCEQACAKAKVSELEISLLIFTDNNVVRNWLQRFDHSKNRVLTNDDRREAMRQRAVKCIWFLDKYGAWGIAWHPRERNVEAFGH